MILPPPLTLVNLETAKVLIADDVAAGRLRTTGDPVMLAGRVVSELRQHLLCGVEVGVEIGTKLGAPRVVEVGDQLVDLP